VDAILCHTSQIGDRTKEAFQKERAEREAKDPGKPIEERFRRWSIRRPPRPAKPEDEKKDEEAAVTGKAKPQHAA
jgi:hypothetical protein